MIKTIIALTILSHQLTSACTDNMTYKVTLKVNWPETPASIYPEGADGSTIDQHVTPMALISHASTVNLWQTGQSASEQVAEVAVSGKTDKIETLFKSLLDANTATDDCFLSKLNDRDDDDSCNIEFTPTNSFLSGIAMLAPSPDWFIGVSALDMCDTTTNKWKTTGTVKLYGYDAGVRTGTTWALSTTTNTEVIRRGIDLEISEANTIPVEAGLKIIEFATLSFEEGKVSIMVAFSMMVLALF